MKDFTGQRTEVVSIEKTEKKLTVVSRIVCKKNEFECTDVYEKADEAGSVLVTSRLHCTKGKGTVCLQCLNIYYFMPYFLRRLSIFV